MRLAKLAVIASASALAALAVDRIPSAAQTKAQGTTAPERIAVTPKKLSPAALARPAQKPYQPVAVILPPASNDATLAAFRQDLVAVARHRVYHELSGVVVAQGFFWDRDFDGTFDPKKSAVDNLAAALRLESRGGSGWDLLAALAGETSAAPIPSRNGVLCGPARPQFDDGDLERLLDATRSSMLDWAYPRTDRTPVRAAPRADAANIDTLGLHFIRFLGFEANDNDLDPWRTSWARIATPAGTIGFVAPMSLMSPAGEQLCFRQDGFGRWHIAGYVGAGN
jgi:hypothetical protein